MGYVIGRQGQTAQIDSHSAQNRRCQNQRPREPQNLRTGRFRPPRRDRPAASEELGGDADTSSVDELSI